MWFAPTIQSTFSLSRAKIIDDPNPRAYLLPVAKVRFQNDNNLEANKTSNLKPKPARFLTFPERAFLRPQRTNTMKQLTNYSKNGHEFRLEKRDGDIAIFLGKKITEYESGWKVISENWEVIHIQSHQGREIHGKHFEPAEFPPSSEQWGTKGFTCAGFMAADKRFKAEIEKRNTPQAP